MRYSKTRRREDARICGPMNAAMQYCRTGNFPAWLNGMDMKYMQAFWKYERKMKYVGAGNSR